MAEIKFTTARMAEVRDRLDEIITQLNEAVNNANEKINSISSNIQSENVTGILSSYSTSVSETCTTTVNHLNSLNEYLNSKIGTYTSIDQSGIESMSEVQSILNQLGN